MAKTLSRYSATFLRTGREICELDCDAHDVDSGACTSAVRFASAARRGDVLSSAFLS